MKANDVRLDGFEKVFHADPTTMFVKPDRTEKGEEDMSSKTTQFWGVVTSNKEKADKIFDEIEKEYRGRIVKKVFTPELLDEKRFTRFEDGNVLSWLIPSLAIRGYRYHRIWLDKDITDKEILNCVIYPKLYCKEDDVIWI